MDKRYFGVTPGPIDSVGVARASGMDAIRVTSLDELREAVTEALRGGKPLYIDVQVPHVIDEVPPVPAWHRALDGDNERPVY
jgi:acetolactate synthase-1/2/3 large subunit